MVESNLKSDTAEDIFMIGIALLVFHSIPNFPIVRQYIEKSPYIIFGIAVVLLIYRKRILNMFK